jgi:Fe-S cluster assembly ATP-binding protein
MSKEILVIENLHVSVEGKEILKGLNLTVKEGELHALMGPNGSGKSTLSFCLLAHPKYKTMEGRILYQGEDVASLSTDERAKRGLFLAFQYPTAIPGVTIANFLRTALKAVSVGELHIKEFRALVKNNMKSLEIPDSFLNRYVNDGFSGGEKKRIEVLQMAILKPKLAVLDETDSGLDIDALKVVANGINLLRSSERAMLLITHYQRLLNYVTPDFVHVIVNGSIVRSGGPELAIGLEKEGYAAFKPFEAAEKL